jgi:hypothetical protein
MALFLPSGGGLGSGLSLAGGRVPMRINFDYFLDREDVIAMIGKRKAKALRKAGYKVMQTARRSIQKKGLARPKLKVMRDNPKMKLEELIRSPTVKDRDKKKLMQRLDEIKWPLGHASAPGTPPNTHTGTMRRDIVFAYDPVHESVVIGSFMQGGAWLASLHEFGGTMQMQAWAWIPKYPRSYTKGILGWWRVGRSPKNTRRWEPTKFRETFAYPKRPYMSRAIRVCVENGDVVNSFRVGGL